MKGYYQRQPTNTNAYRFIFMNLYHRAVIPEIVVVLDESIYVILRIYLLTIRYLYYFMKRYYPKQKDTIRTILAELAKFNPTDRACLDIVKYINFKSMPTSIELHAFNCTEIVYKLILRNRNVIK